MDLVLKQSTPWGKLWSGTFMVFGTTVGAGMLGIPSMTASAGFGPACFVTFLVWVFMAITGLLLLEVTLKMPQGANLISMAGRFLGRKGSWVTGVLFLFLYYCLLIAYLAGGAPLLGQMFSWVGIELPALAQKIIFLTFFGGIILLGVHSINRANLALTSCMLISYVILIVLGSGFVETVHLSFVESIFAVGAIPVLFSAFGFHNVIPPLSTYLKRDKKTLRISILLGTFLALALYLIWQWLVLGSISVDALAEVTSKGFPITYALQSLSGSKSLYIWGQLFAFFALTTSFLGVGFSFVDFIQDGFKEGKYIVSRFTCSLLTLIPPFICVLLDPSIFERALGLAGGFGESILNGILPVAFFAKMKGALKWNLKAALVFLVLLSLGVVFIEIYSLCF